MQITIDDIFIEVQPGMTVLQAAAAAGIEIPSMCYREGYVNRPSCMVCVVKDLDSGKIIPSCAWPVAEGMRISASGGEVMQARREALELLLSDHVGDCEAPCRLSCPAFMDIPRMNRLIAAGRIAEALQVVREEIALPLALGYICPAPCENACRRKKVDQPVSICLLKRYTAMDEEIRRAGLSPSEKPTGKRVAVIGTGPAGLSAAFFLLQMGHACVLFDKSELPGGALRYSIPDDLLPKDMLDADIESIRLLGGTFRLGKEIDRKSWEEVIRKEFDAVILATGFQEDHPVEAFQLQPVKEGQMVDKKRMNTSVPGVFGCGSIISEQLLSVRSVAQGKRAALEADAWLKGDSAPRKSRFNSAIGPMDKTELEQYMQEASRDVRIDPGKGYLAGFSEQEAMQEALRCMHCDCRKPDSCKLRLYADQYGADRKRFAPAERNRLVRNLQHELVVYEPEKCIRCGLCIGITQKEAEPLGLAFVGRGFDVRVGTPFSASLQESLTRVAEACVEACPTGALGMRNGEM